VSNPSPVSRGALTLVATPIGNLGDLSPRAVEALRHASVIACEDTRRTRGLLSHLSIRTPRMIVVNEHTEHSEADKIADLVDEGHQVALVSDAGTPAVSDPGQRVVAAVLARGGHIEVIPGPSAVLAALIASGLDTHRFCVDGFLPRSGSARRERLDELAREPRTTVLYEAPHRLHSTLRDLLDGLGPARRIVIARELTKLHEQWWRGTLDDAVRDWEHQEARGEFVLVVEGWTTGASDAPDLVSAIAAELAAGESPSRAAAAVASALGVPKKVAYQEALAQSASASDTNSPSIVAERTKS
jgi:16S rRNA (cytidine1402-2'-O)-methyltransferase